MRIILNFIRKRISSGGIWCILYFWVIFFGSPSSVFSIKIETRLQLAFHCRFYRDFLLTFSRKMTTSGSMYGFRSLLFVSLKFDGTSTNLSRRKDRQFKDGGSTAFLIRKSVNFYSPKKLLRASIIYSHATFLLWAEDFFSQET